MNDGKLVCTFFIDGQVGRYDPQIILAVITGKRRVVFNLVGDSILPDLVIFYTVEGVVAYKYKLILCVKAQTSNRVATAFQRLKKNLETILIPQQAVRRGNPHGAAAVAQQGINAQALQKIVIVVVRKFLSVEDGDAAVRANPNVAFPVLLNVGNVGLNQPVVRRVIFKGVVLRKNLCDKKQTGKKKKHRFSRCMVFLMYHAYKSCKKLLNLRLFFYKRACWLIS